MIYPSILKILIINAKNTTMEFLILQTFYRTYITRKFHLKRFFCASIEIFAIAATELRVFLCDSIYSDSALHTAATFSDI